MDIRQTFPATDNGRSSPVSYTHLSPGPIVFRIWVANAAVCLIRGGWHEEALELAEPETAELRPWEKQLAGWQPPESRGGLFWKSQLSLTESHIRSLCLENFGQTEAVEAETAFQKKCLERSSLLRKQPIGRRLHLEHQIRRWADRKPERAIAVLEAYLEDVYKRQHKILINCLQSLSIHIRF